MSDKKPLIERELEGLRHDRNMLAEELNNAKHCLKIANERLVGIFTGLARLEIILAHKEQES